MRTIFINIIILSICLIYACNRKKVINNEVTNRKENILIINNDKKVNKTIGNSETILSDSVNLRITKISNGCYSLKIESYYINDNVNLSNDFIDNVVLKQVISFFLKDSLMNKIDFPVRKLKVNTEKGKTVKIQENNIYMLGIVKGKNGWFYKISGGGVLASQSEFYGIYSPKGKLLWYSYSTYQNFKKMQKMYPNEGYGDLDKILKEYSINEEEFNKPEDTIYVGAF